MQSQKVGYFRAYGAFWRYYANFNRRTSKEAFWKAYFVHNLIYLAVCSPIYYIYESLIKKGDLAVFVWIIPLGIYCAATFIPTIAIVVRRLHDIDRHGCWFFLYLIPIAGIIIFFVMLSRASAPYDVFPGRSGSGPYTVTEGAKPYVQPQNPYARPYGQPQNPYVPLSYYRPLPPPRHYAPQAGGNKAVSAIILSIIVAVASNVYGFVCNDYIVKNMNRYYNVLFGNMVEDYFGSLYDDPYGWGSDPWNDGDLWGGENPGEGDEYWGDDPEYYGKGKEPMTEEELAAIDYVKNSMLEGFPEYTIEEVLLSRVDGYGLEWECYEDEVDGAPILYISVVGYAAGDFVVIYADFDLYDDGTIKLYNLDDGERDEYYEAALEIYKKWYEEMLSNTDDTLSA